MLCGIYISFANEDISAEETLPTWVVFQDKEKEKVFRSGYAAAFDWVASKTTEDPKSMIPEKYKEHAPNTLLWMQGFSVGQWEAWYDFPPKEK